jgi:hypothetical protein
LGGHFGGRRWVTPLVAVVLTKRPPAALTQTVGDDYVVLRSQRLFRNIFSLFFCLAFFIYGYITRYVALRSYVSSTRDNSPSTTAHDEPTTIHKSANIVSALATAKHLSASSSLLP